MIDNYYVLYNYYKEKKISKLKNDIKHEKNMFQKKILEQIYNQLMKEAKNK